MRWAVAQFVSLMAMAVASVAIARSVPSKWWFLWPVAAVSALGPIRVFEIIQFPEITSYRFLDGLIFAGHWATPFVDLVAVLLPALLARRGAVQSRIEFGRSSPVVPWLFSTGLALFVLSVAINGVDGNPLEQSRNLAAIVLAAALALATQSKRLWLSVPTIGFAAWAGGFAPIVLYEYIQLDSVQQLLPLAAAVIFALANQADRLLSSLKDTPWRSVVILNALNIVDAVATSTQLRAGRVEEVNPFILDIGFGPKVVIVAAASLTLAKYRPAVLPSLVAVYTGVVAWHIAGALLLG